jgi:hypothetical protein
MYAILRKVDDWLLWLPGISRLTADDSNAGSFKCSGVSSYSFLKAKKNQKTLARINSLGRGLRFPFQFIF